ncbi:hypothetical protein [Alteromonas sp. C1M14]|uniref:hypothetical protein n=1 Tax=Alteromonas sp. C1M14 TaxID=2841567 RepID=UPI001C083656|nr:hypothetical protein [Alteromonas sp. C1M14]MBU2978216.1 hypothetical protein [Alteromonas sp. C1M14]
MHHLFKTLAFALTFGLLSVPVYAADNPNLLVMGEDADEDSVPRNSRVFKRVVYALQGQMNYYSFDVYDETYVTMDNFTQGRVRRSDGELFDIARSVKRPPIDVVVVFTMYASAQQQEHTTKVKARITGRMINAKSGKFIDTFEVDSGQFWNAPTECSRECILEVVGDKAKILADELGAVLAEKLDWLVEGHMAENGQDRSATNDMITDYYLVFDGFSAEDFMDIEEYLVIFSGYKSHRPTEQRHTRSEVLYRSSIGTAKLSRNLKKMLGELDMRATTTFEGNTFTIKRILRRGEKRKPTEDGGW